MFKETPVSSLLTREVVTVQTFKTEVWEKLILKKLLNTLPFSWNKMAVWEEKERSSLQPNIVERERGTDWGFPFLCKTSGELGLCSQHGCSTERTQHLYVSNRHFPSNQTPSLLSSLSSTSLCIDNVIKSALLQYSSHSDIWRQPCVRFPLG